MGSGDVLLDEDKRHQRQRATDQTGQHEGTAPTHGRMPIRLDAVGGADQQGGQAEGEQDVAGDIQVLVLADGGRLVQGQVSPDGAADGERNADQEDIAPVDGCQDPAGQQADERAARTGDHVDAHGQAALVGRKGIREDGSGVGHQEGPSHGLDQAEDDDLHGGAVPGAMHQVEQDRAGCKDGKAEVVHAYPPEHVGDAAEGDQQRGGYHQVAHQGPQQVIGFAARQGVDADPVEDGWQRYLDDAPIEHRHENSQGGVGKGDPFIGDAPLGDVRFLSHWFSLQARRVSTQQLLGR